VKGNSQIPKKSHVLASIQGDISITLANAKRHIMNNLARAESARAVRFRTPGHEFEHHPTLPFISPSTAI